MNTGLIRGIGLAPFLPDEVVGNAGGLGPGFTDGFVPQLDSLQPGTIGLGTRAYNYNNQQLLNASGLLIGESSSAHVVGIEYGSSTTYTNGPTYYSLNLTDNPTFTTSNLNAASSFLNIGGVWTVNSVSGKATLAGINIAPVLNGTAKPAVFAGIQVQPNYTQSTLTLGTMYGMLVNPHLSSAASVTTLYGLSIGSAFSGAGAALTMIGLDVGVTNPIAPGNTTTWGIRVGSYNSYFNGNTTFGGTTIPAFAVDVEGGNAATNAIGISPSTVAPSPAASIGAISLYQGTAGNKYFMVTYNDAGTTRYKYVILDTTGVTWTTTTTLPT